MTRKGNSGGTLEGSYDLTDIPGDAALLAQEAASAAVGSWQDSWARIASASSVHPKRRDTSVGVS